MENLSYDHYVSKLKERFLYDLIGMYREKLINAAEFLDQAIDFSTPEEFKVLSEWVNERVRQGLLTYLVTEFRDGYIDINYLLLEAEKHATQEEYERIFNWAKERLKLKAA